MIKLSLQSTWAHKRRLVGTFLAILIGVSFLSGTLVLGDTLRESFDKLFKAGYSGIDVVVRPERPKDAEGEESSFSSKTLDASLADEIEQLPGVRAAVAETLTFGQVIGKDGEPLGGQGPPTFAANWDDDEGLNPYEIVKGRAPEAPEEVVLDDVTFADGKFEVGDTARLLLPEPLDVTVVGVAQFGDGESALGVTYAFFSAEGTATHLTKVPGQANTIVVAGEDGVSEAELRDRIAPIIGEGNEALTGEEAADEAVDDINRDFLGFFTTFLVVFSGVAVFVASFSIYNTFSIIVAQRTRESALMRAIGATQGQVLLATMVEALIIGVLASVVGIVFGVGVAAGLKNVLGGFGLDLPAGGLTVNASGIVIGLVVGIVVTLLAALFPARRGSRVRPIEALRASAIEAGVPRGTRSVLGGVVSLLAVAAVVYGALAEPDGQIWYVGIGAFSVLVGMLILGPVAARPVARGLGAPIARLRGVPGELARENAVRNPRRTSSTAAALLVGVTIVVLFSVFIASLKALVTDAVDRTFGGDLVVTRGGFGLPSLPPSLAGQVGELDGIRQSVGLGFGPATIADGGEDFYAHADVAALAGIVDLGPEEGSVDSVGPDAIGISTDIATDEKLSLGDTVEVSFTDGTVAEQTVALIYEHADIVGGYLLPRETAMAHTDGAADVAVFVQLDEGASVTAARKEIRTLTDPLGKPEIQDRQEYTDSIAQQLDMLLGLVTVMLTLAIVIAAMGIANTIALSVYERTREIGLLRAVGTTRVQVRRMVRWEAVIVATFGTVGGIGLGIGLGWALTRAALADSASQPFAVPVGNLVTIVLFGVLVGVLAAARPAYRAAKAEVLGAISEE